MAGPTVAVELFVSADLPRHWARLDEFEGTDYLRLLVPLFSGTGVVAVANLYSARQAADGRHERSAK